MTRRLEQGLRRPSAWAVSLVIALLLSTIIAEAKGIDDLDRAVRVEAFSSNATIHRGGGFRLAVRARIPKGLHINSHQPADRFLIPTVVSFRKTQGVMLGPVSYPAPILKTFPFAKHEMPVYEDTVSFIAAGELSPEIPLGDLRLSGTLAYQACSDESCLVPESQSFEVTLTVVDRHQPAKLIHQGIFATATDSLSADELRARSVIEKGFFYALVAFFVFGLALNLTPCVYPVIPLTVGFFSTRDATKKTQALGWALLYVLGIAVVFSTLGLLSGLAGRQWGFLFQETWFVIGIALVMLTLAASMFGAFEITVPSWIMSRAGKARSGWLGSFFMGLTAGVVIAPCAAGIVIGLVGIIAKLGLVVKGAVLFFAMGLGLGLPYLFLALFSGMLHRLPRAGMWMIWIRKLFGLLLIGLALYFLIPHGKQLEDQQGFYLGVLAIFGGLLLGLLDRHEDDTRVFKVLRSLIGGTIIALGITMVHGALHHREIRIDWTAYESGTVEGLVTGEKPVLIDFYAEWCTACRELDAETFSDDDVAELARRFTMLRVDCTRPSLKLQGLMRRFQVTGLPTIVFLSQGGEELPELRVVGFLAPGEMQRRMEKALSPPDSTAGGSFPEESVGELPEKRL